MVVEILGDSNFVLCFVVLRQRFLSVMESFESEEGSTASMPKSRDVFHASNLVLKVYKSEKSGVDLEVLDKLCRFVEVDYLIPWTRI